MKIACLAVTCRPAFREWLTWNYEKQTHADKELVIVEGDRDVVHARNAALARSRGDAIAGFDDDDWSAPDRLATAARALEEYPGVFGSTRGAFCDLLTGRACEVSRTGGVFFNGAVVCAPYPALIAPGAAEDVRWLEDATKVHAIGGTLALVSDRPLHVWLCHATNLVNRRSRHQYSMTPAELVALVGGANVWQDTSERFAALRRDAAVWAQS